MQANPVAESSEAPAPPPVLTATVLSVSLPAPNVLAVSGPAGAAPAAGRPFERPRACEAAPPNHAAVFAMSPLGGRVVPLLPVSCLLTYGTTLLLCYTLFLTDGKKHWDPNVTVGYTVGGGGGYIPIVANLHDRCSEILCDVSVYGGWPGPCRWVFGLGLTFLAAQLTVMVECRVGLWKCVIPDQLGMAGTLACGRCSALAAIASLLLMCWIPFNVSPVHFLAAVSVFLNLASAQCCDTSAFSAVRTMQAESLIVLLPAGAVHGGGGGGGGEDDTATARNDGETSSASASPLAASRVPSTPNVACYFRFFSCVGILCFLLWFVAGTIFEWLATFMPFVYFLPFSWQHRWAATIARGGPQSIAARSQSGSGSAGRYNVL